MNKIIITNKADNVIINIVDNANQTPNGLLVTEGNQEYILGFYNSELYNKFDNIEVTEDILPQKHCYDGVSFILNPNFADVKTQDEKIVELEQNKTEMQDTINSLIVATGGNVLEVPTEETLDNIKAYQKGLIGQMCQVGILSGFKSSAYQGIEKIYGSTIADQANIIGNALSATFKLTVMLGCENDKFYYHAKGEEFVEFTAQECLDLARDFKGFKEQLLFKSKQLQNYIDHLTTNEEVKAVTWDIVIPN